MNQLSKISPVVREIANLIGEAAVELQQPPQQIDPKVFRGWLKDSRGADATTLKQVDMAIKAAGGFGVLRDAFFPPVVTTGSVESLALKQISTSNRKIQRQQSNTQLELDRFEATVEKMLSKIERIKPKLTTVTSEPSERFVTLFLSDNHVGARLDRNEVMWDFHSVETARRLAYVATTTLNYKKDHRSQTTLNLVLGGDNIQGLLKHGGGDGAPLAEQFAEALHLYIQVIRVLRMGLGEGKHKVPGYPKIRIYGVSGNHDRNVAFHEGRATHAKADYSFATKLYVALKRYFEGWDGVEFYIPKTPWAEIEMFGERAYFTHGDTNLNPGNPGSAINVRQLEVQMNRINIGEVQAGKKPYKVFGVGHVHFGSLSQIPGGYYMITNPALIHRDSYGLNFGHGQAMGQTLFESVEGHLVGDYRIIELNFDIDKDSQLDKVIAPYVDW